MSKIIIEYFPEGLSHRGVTIIRENISASMMSSDESTFQYEIGQCKEELETKIYENSFEDLLIINRLIKEGVSFIEI